MQILPTLALASIWCLGALGGCGDGAAGEETGPLTVSAAASLAQPLERYGETLPGGVRLSLGGSGALAAQIRQGARPDVFASADPIYPDQLASEGLVEKPIHFARNRLVLAVPADSAIGSIADLGSPGLDLVLGARGVPVGDYAREAIDRFPAPLAEALTANVRSEESDVRGIVGKLVQGAADAGFVYGSDVAAAGDRLRSIALPRRLSPPVTYSAAVVAGAAEPERARDFIDGLVRGAGNRALLEAGFRSPDGS